MGRWFEDFDSELQSQREQKDQSEKVRLNEAATIRNKVPSFFEELKGDAEEGVNFLRSKHKEFKDLEFDGRLAGGFIVRNHPSALARR